MFDALARSGSLTGLRQPTLDQYERSAFTQLDMFLEQAQIIAQQREKRILLAFHEYEALEKALKQQAISERVLGKLRNLIQHNPMIVVLVSGKYRIEELTCVNWASYLINTHALELSFLEPDAAHELLTKPLPELEYTEGVMEEIIHATHCQPYLLQMVASELVNHLNSQKRTLANLDDVEVACRKTLKTASTYFTETWYELSNPEEQTVLRALAHPIEVSASSSVHSSLWQSLPRKELVEVAANGHYQLAVPLFARWIREHQ